MGLPVVGAMGAAVGRALVGAGRDVVTCVAGRSGATEARAARAGLRCVDTLAELVAEADVILTIAPSDVALSVAQRVGALARGRETGVVYVDANPVPRGVCAEIEAQFAAGRDTVVDASIFGLPPGDGTLPLLLVAGGCAAPLAFLDGVAFRIRAPAVRFGDAAQIKLLQIAASKVTNANLALMCLAAQRAGLLPEVLEVLSEVNADLAARAGRSLPWMPVDATRFAQEMEVLRAAFEDLDLPTSFPRAAGDVLRGIAGADLGPRPAEGRAATHTAPEILTAWDRHWAAGDRERDARAGFALTLMTDALEEAQAAARAGVDRVGPDLEVLGKSERQPNMGTRVSVHDEASVAAFAAHVSGAEVFARVDPIHDGSAPQIERLIGQGARTLMLPYFHRVAEAEAFVGHVAGRARVTLLVETAAAFFRVPEFLALEGVDEIHFGLTDLMLSSGVGSRYDVLLSPIFAQTCRMVTERGMPLHIAGVGAIDDTTLPISADLTLARYVDLGATGSLLTRAFLSSQAAQADLPGAMETLRARIDYWRGCPQRTRDAAEAELRATIRTLKAQGRKIP
ncbi:MAG: aldolase/citrate lyase family protein [Pseudomonadota bacterium]